MKQIKKLAEDVNYTAIDLGDLNDLMKYSLIHPVNKQEIEGFSGGEIDLANLVLRIAISKTLTELSGTSTIGFLAFDEVFGSQDKRRFV